MTAPTLRPYQLAALDRLEAEFAAGKRAPLLVAPTGAGKTVLAAAIVDRARRRGDRVLFLVPRRELVAQTCEKFDAVGLRYGVILAGQAQHDGYAPVQVASIDTLQARMVRHRRLTLPTMQLVIIDEAHLGVTAARRRLLELFPGARRIGLTATPSRRDGRALGQFYDALVEVATPAELTAAGFLVPARYFAPSDPDLTGVRTVAGEFHGGDLEAAINRPTLIADVVATWLERAHDRRTVVFATSIAHSVALAREFEQHGVAAAHVDANTLADDRRLVFSRFRAGALQVLCNCQLASYGFDLPELSCVVRARPTRSLVLYLQMIGRGLRTAPGKADCLVLDHAGNVHRHGFAVTERPWTIAGEWSLAEPAPAERREREPRTLTCAECQAVFSGSRVCTECGWCPYPRGREVQTLEGELVELGAGLPTERLDELQFYLELRGEGERYGRKPGWAAYAFRDKFGRMPPWSWADLPPAVPSLATRSWVKGRAIRWAKRRPRAVEA